MGSTARKSLLQTWQLGITLQGTASQPDVPIGNGDSIEFLNSARFPVKITFTTSSGKVFNDIPSIAANGGRSTPQSAQQSNVTVNYTITDTNTGAPQGPYAVEVGTGPLRINIAAANPTPQTMSTVSIPLGGEIQFDCDASYTISWNPANVVSPNVDPLLQGLNQVQTAQTGNQVTVAAYDLFDTKGVTGHGTVKIGS
jgi:hypothetical protein